MDRPIDLLIQLAQADGKDFLLDLEGAGVSLGSVENIEGFDGAALSEIVIPVASAVIIPILERALRAIVQKRKSFRAIINGNVYEGYSAEDLESIIHALHQTQSDSS